MTDLIDPYNTDWKNILIALCKLYDKTKGCRSMSDDTYVYFCKILNIKCRRIGCFYSNIILSILDRSCFLYIISIVV